jgi:arylsulfatase A-like enzyme
LAQTTDRPNIVIVMADDMGYGDVSSYNSYLSAVATPNIDALATAGMRFTDAHTPSAVCSPTRYGLLTGDHNFRIGRPSGVQFNYGDVWVAPTKRTVAQVLREAGYTTGFVGKWHLGYNVYDARGNRITGDPKDQSIVPDWSRGISDDPNERGFDYSFGHVASADISPYKYFENGAWVTSEAVWTPRGGGSQIDQYDGSVRPGWNDPDGNFNTIQRTLQTKALQFINDNAGGEKPFFLYVPLSAPHTPDAPHPDFLGDTTHRYTDYVKEVDSIVGNVVQALADKGQLDNTLIIYTSDNGANAGRANHSDHRGTGVFPDGTYLRGQKADVWEGGHRVPFIARWGDGTPAGSRVQPGTVNDELINLLDITRTAATLAGAPLLPTEAVDSWNILPALLGDGTDQLIREAEFNTSHGGAYVIAQKDDEGNEWKLIFSSGSGGGFSSPKGTKVNPNQEDVTDDIANLQLYNLAVDPGETTNLLSGTPSSETMDKLLELHGLMLGYIRTGRSAPGGLLGDLNFDGLMDVGDWQLYLDGLNTDLTGLPITEAYGLGDLNSDLLNDYDDFLLFQRSYDRENGAGAFDAMVAGVPEPASVVLLITALGILFWHSRSGFLC